jgi:hypothetical protein
MALSELGMVAIHPDKLRSIIEEVVHVQIDRLVAHHLKHMIETAKDEATKAIAKRLLELVVKEQLETQ